MLLTIEVDDEQIAAALRDGERVPLTGRLIESPAPSTPDRARASAQASATIPTFELIEDRGDEDHTYHVPNGTSETLRGYRVYEARSEAGSMRLAIAKGDRALPNRQRDRHWFTVMRLTSGNGERQLVVFTETDDGQFISPIRRGTSLAMLNPGDELPPVLAGLRVAEIREVIDVPGSPRKLGVLGDDGEVEPMLRLGWLRAHQMGFEPR